MDFRRSFILHVLLVAATGAVVMLPELGQRSRVDGREARHAEIAREMVESGDWVVPRSLGTPYIDKPPLFNWVVGVLFRVTGRVDLWAARLPSALGAVGIALGIYFVGRRWGSPRAGLLAALIWLGFPMTAEWARMARMDMLMSCLIFLAVAAAAGVEEAGDAVWRHVVLWAAAGALLAAAVLAKGPQALFFFATALVLMWCARRGRRWSRIGLAATCLAAVMATAAAWVVLTELANPGHMAELSKYQFGRAVGEEHTSKRLYLYLDQAVLTTVPWSLLAPGVGLVVARRLRRSGLDQWSVPALVFGVALVVLTVFPNKRPHYMLPALPFWALAVGLYVDEAAGGDGSGRRVPRWALRWPLGMVLAVATAAALAIPVVVQVRQGACPAAVWGLGVGAALVGAAGLVGLARGWVGRAAAMLVVLSLLAAGAVYPVLSRYFWSDGPCAAAADAIAGRMGQGDAVAAADTPATPSYETLVFLLNRRVVFCEGPEQLRGFLAGGGRRWVLRGVRREAAGKPEQRFAGFDEVSAGRGLRRVGDWALNKSGDTRVELWVRADRAR